MATWYGWVERGIPERRIASSSSIRLSMATIYPKEMVVTNAMLTRAVTSLLQNERGDAFNRHEILHIREHFGSNMRGMEVTFLTLQLRTNAIYSLNRFL